MTRFLLWTSTVWITFVALLFGVYASGAPNTSASTLSDYQCTPQPCWHGINPGTTSINEAAAILNSDKSLKVGNPQNGEKVNQLCWEKNGTAAVKEGGCYFQTPATGVIYWNHPKNPYTGKPLTFADAINLFGTPIGLRVCYDLTTEFSIYASLVFDGSVRVNGSSYALAHFKGRITMDTQVASIMYSQQPASAVIKWNGFVRISEIHYC